MNPRANLPPRDRLAEYCRAHGIARLEVFGSALRDDFGPDSDIDLLVVFEPGRAPGMFRLHRVEEGLSRLFGRRVDLVSRRGVELSRNPLRRDSMLEVAETIYAI